MQTHNTRNALDEVAVKVQALELVVLQLQLVQLFGRADIHAARTGVGVGVRDRPGIIGLEEAEVGPALHRLLETADWSWERFDELKERDQEQPF